MGNLTDLICIIILGVDMGFRISSIVSYFTSLTNPEGKAPCKASNGMVSKDEPSNAEMLKSTQPVQTLQMQDTQDMNTTATPIPEGQDNLYVFNTCCAAR